MSETDTLDEARRWSSEHHQISQGLFFLYIPYSVGGLTTSVDSYWCYCALLLFGSITAIPFRSRLRIHLNNNHPQNLLPYCNLIEFFRTKRTICRRFVEYQGLKSCCRTHMPLLCNPYVGGNELYLSSLNPKPEQINFTFNLQCYTFLVWLWSVELGVVDK